MKKTLRILLILLAVLLFAFLCALVLCALLEPHVNAAGTVVLTRI